ncbi:unnamed protein product [Dracunculus medinensis]|uniref:Adenosine kinase n=1 Tax=Dracunculus medinensis TaxID=318479 RepID=A0A0N4UDZ5_DRAME|nr:unnamed protein product [Dracunculus medinensis]
MHFEGILLGCGNPLLDIQTHIDNQEFFKKWNLKENDSIVADESLIPMFDELMNEFDVTYIPGGATLNSLRVCQWLLNTPKLTTFFGAIGNDKYGKILAEKCRAAGVNVQFQVNDDVKTGTCAALIYKEHRSLCADLAAANTFTIDHIIKPENKKLIEKAKFFYISAFFLPVCPQAVSEIAKHALAHNKTFSMNLAAPYISMFSLDLLLEMFLYIDILFGNAEEAQAFAAANKFKEKDLKDIVRKIAIMPKLNNNRHRIVVITQGGDPIIVVEGNNLIEYPVTKLTIDEIRDTNGAGDAFVGGFLAEYIQNKSIEKAVKCGQYAALAIIKQDGCSLPPICDYSFSN